MKHLLLPCSLPLPLPLPIHRPSKPLLLLHARHRRCRAPNAAPPDGNSGNPSTAAPEAPSTDTRPTVTTPSSSKPTSVKNRLRSRNQARRVQDQEAYLPPVEVGVMKGKAPRASGTAAAAAPRREEKPRRRKGWEEMSLAEKAVELYVGEKGALFWLNKFAYASIFIMAGAWILFRFVGPSLGLYQLDAPPLAPTDVLRGS